MEEKEKLFRQIIAENQERIYRICAFHSKDQDDCNDLFQQVLINTWQSMRNFRGESKVSTWMYRIALNTCIDHFRAEKRRGKTLREFQQEYSQRALMNDTWEKVKMERQLEELKVQINQLSVIDKLIISLFLEEVGSKEIAEVIGISEGNVRVKIHRIKENLKLKLGDSTHE